jgi:membrane-associated protease RseP (regulator of RpoE activity)
LDLSHEEPGALTSPVGDWVRPPKFQDRVWLHVSLFVLTVVFTTWAGASHYASFLSDFSEHPLNLSMTAALVGGLWYSLTILSILGCHEMGHYLACRYYDVDASLPFFIPMPLLLTGTMGAFIRIREPIPSKRMLFDIGIAGPIARFLVAVPALFFGLAMSHVVRVPTNVPLFELGEPLLFKLFSTVLWGTPPEGYSLNLHPVAFAAWFGLLATALNLFPIGQLDGGHISYAVLGGNSRYVTRAMIGVALVLTYFYRSWLVWTIVMLLMLRMFGWRHPPTRDEHVPLDRTRKLFAAFALIIFALCFTPAPIEPIELIRKQQLATSTDMVGSVSAENR